MVLEFDWQSEEHELLRKALVSLQRVAGVEGKLITHDQKVSGRHHADAIVDLQANEQCHRYIVECHAVVERTVALSNVKAQLQRLPSPGLLVTRYLSAEMAERCRVLGLEFIDSVGNAYLNAPGMYVFVKGQKDADGKAISGMGRGSGNPTASRMIFALLCQPELVQAPYREIVQVAGIALGAVGSVFEDLAKRGFLTKSEKKHGRRLLEPKRLLDEWIANYPTTLRPKLNPRRFRAADPNWWKEIELDDLGAFWGGEVAAERITKNLKPVTQTLYVRPEAMNQCLKKLITTYRLRPDPDGPIEILEAFWETAATQEYQDLVPPILVYADLMATLDPRNIEVAGMIREGEIENALRKR